uniref:Uncharacterized protein n=1 Tax=Guillardia theta TaxID=55529 RepID=A0A7S4N1V6_GUITH
MTELSWLNLADNLAHLQQVNFGASEIVRAPQELPMEPSKLVDQGSDLEETCNLSSSLPTTPRGPGHSVKTEKRFFFFRRTAAIEAKSLNTSLRPKSIQAAVADGEEEVQNALRFRPAPLLHVSSPAEAQASFIAVRRWIENEKIREREQILEESRSKHKHGDVKRFDKQDINTRNQFLRSQDHSATAAPERVLSSVGIILHHADNGEVWIEDANKDPFLLHQSRYEQSEQTDEEAENGRKQSLSKNHSLARTTRVLGPLRSHSGYIGILLDLDHTTIYGQDGNDLSIAFQLNGLDFSALCKLYTHLLNPQVKDLLERIRKLGYMFEVALYTRRSHLLSYMSLLRRRVISLKWREDWHFGSSHCLIPSNISSAEEVLETYRGVALMPQEKQDLHMSLNRLLAARTAIKDMLGLEVAPNVILTCQDKDVLAVSRVLGMPEDSTFLWDDNLELRHDPRVVLVEPFDKLHATQRSTLLSFLDATLPAAKLSNETVAFMLSGAQGRSSLTRGEDGLLRYTIPAANESFSFPLPRKIDVTASSRRRPRSLSNMARNVARGWLKPSRRSADVAT